MDKLGLKLNMKGSAKGLIKVGLLFTLTLVVVLSAYSFLSLGQVQAQAALTSTNVQPMSLQAGSNTSADINFTTAAAVPADGKIVVEFPTSFNVSNANGSCSSMDGSFSTSVSGTIVTLTRSGGSSQSAAAETCRIDNVINPRITGSAGVYKIYTRDSGDSTIDLDESVGADTILAGTLTSANVQPYNLTVGANTTVEINFTTVNAIPLGGTIRIVFPSGFSLGGSGTCLAGTDGSWNTTVSARNLILTKNGDGTQVNNSRAISCYLNVTRNPEKSGNNGTYFINTTNAANVLIDNVSVAGDTLTVAALQSTNVQPMSLNANTNTSVDVNFTTLNPIPSNGQIVIQFPLSYDVSNANGSCSSMDGTFTTTATDSATATEVVLTRQSDGTAQAAAAETCRIDNIITPKSTGSTGAYNINTSVVENSVDVNIDSDLAVSSDTIVQAFGGDLTSVNIQPLNLTAGVNTSIDINFTLRYPLPLNGTINISFGSGFFVGGPGTCNSPNSGTWNTSISGKNVQLIRNSDGVEINGSTAVYCRLNNTVLPNITGSTGLYFINTSNGSDMIDNSSVAADTVLAGHLTSVNVQPLNLSAGANTTIDINFTTKNSIPVGGTISILFPSGFSVGGPGSCDIGTDDGTWNTSITGTLAILRKNNVSSINASTAVSCKLNNTRIAQTSGVTGVYQINTTNAVDVMIDNATSISGDTVTAAALQSTNVQPMVLTSNTNTSADINFTTLNPIPTTGRVIITFPSGFNVSNANGSCSSMDGTFTTTIDGPSVAISRSGTGTQQAAAAETCRVDNIITPKTTGSTGTYVVNTTTLGLAAIDSDMAVTADTVTQGTGGNLETTNVQPFNLGTNKNTSADVNFTIYNPMPVGGKINVSFGSGFNVSNANGSCSSMDGTFNTTVEGTRVIIHRNADGTEQAGNSAETCRIDNIRTPLSTGSTGVYFVNTSDATATVIDNTSVAADTVTQGTNGNLTNSNVQPFSLVAGANVSIDANFTLFNSLPAGGRVVVTFPPNFDVSNANGSCSSMDGTWNTTIVSQQVRLFRNADGTEQAGNSAETCRIENVINPKFSGSHGVYTIVTADASGTAIDRNLSVSADTITSGSLTSANVQPLSLTTNTNTSIDVNFTTTNLVPLGGTINITFPSGFSVGGPGTCTAGTDGSFNYSISGQTVILTKNGDGTQINGSIAVHCRINNTRTPLSTGSTGVYYINTSNVQGALIDNTSVAADTVTQGTGGNLASANVQPLSLGTNTNGSIDINFTLFNSLPAGGKINVSFPSGFSVGGPGTCDTMDGTFNLTISGTSVVFHRNADGTEQAGNSAESCRLNNTRTPLSTGSTGVYFVNTSDATATVIDNTSVAADTVTQGTGGNLASANVQPMVLTTNTNTSVDVNFTIFNSLPAGGKINISFGSGFDVSNANGSCSSMDGTFNTTKTSTVVVIHRNADGTEQAGNSAETCRIDNIRTPLSTGSTGGYFINTSDATATVIDNTSVAADTVTQGTGGTLTSTNVQPYSLAAGGNSSIEINFTLVHPIPAGGIVRVTFGSNFTVDNANGSCSSMDGTFNTTVSGKAVSIIRNGDGSEQAGLSNETCRIGNVINPRITGSTAVYQILTRQSNLVSIDSDTSVSADTMTPGVLTSTNVQPLSLTANTNTSIDVNFTTANPVPLGGTINVTFPSGFFLGGPGTCNNGVIGSFNYTISGQTAVITINTEGINASTAVSCRINNTVTPNVTGSTGTYSINTSNATGNIIDADASVSADTVLQGTGGSILTANIQPLSLIAGTNTSIDINFTLINAIPLGGVINISFGSGFSVGGPGTCNVPNSGTWNTSISGTSVRLIRNSDGSEIASASLISCVLNNTRLPNVTGSTGLYYINTSNSTGTMIDNASVGADTIIAASLTSANVQPFALTTGTNTTVEVNFTIVNAIPVGGTVRVVLGSGFLVGGPGACGVDGTWNSTISGQSVIFRKNGDGTSVNASTALRCQINNTVTPNTAGATGTYHINTTNAADVLIDNTTVSADSIVQGAGGTLISANIQPLSLAARANTSIDVNFTLNNTFPADGILNITFPAGFDLGGAVGTCNSMTGSFNTSISGTLIRLIRNSNGAAENRSTAHTCRINATLNPNVTGTTGTYSIITINSSNIAIDSDASVSADTVTAGAATKLQIYASSADTQSPVTVTVRLQDVGNNNLTNEAIVSLSVNGSARLDASLINTTDTNTTILRSTISCDNPYPETVQITATYTGGNIGGGLTKSTFNVSFTNNFNYSKCLGTGWNTFNIPNQATLESFGKTASTTGNFNFTTVLASLGSNWNYMYYNINGSSNGWVLATRSDFASSTLKYLNNTNDNVYWINMTSSGRFTL